jgi:hypothetical protein
MQFSIASQAGLRHQPPHPGTTTYGIVAIADDVGNLSRVVEEVWCRGRSHGETCTTAKGAAHRNNALLGHVLMYKTAAGIHTSPGVLYAIIRRATPAVVPPE